MRNLQKGPQPLSCEWPGCTPRAFCLLTAVSAAPHHSPASSPEPPLWHLCMHCSSLCMSAFPAAAHLGSQVGFVQLAARAERMGVNGDGVWLYSATRMQVGSRCLVHRAPLSEKWCCDCTRQKCWSCLCQGLDLLLAQLHIGRAPWAPRLANAGLDRDPQHLPPLLVSPGQHSGEWGQQLMPLQHRQGPGTATVQADSACRTP